MNVRQPLNPIVQSGLIMLASGLVASVLCAKVYGATLPVTEPPSATEAAVSAPAGTNAADAAAAAQLRAMLTGQPVLLGTQAQTEPRR